ncbi:MAG: sensor domain-containing diguanylate cyclase [Thiobacillus sp.]|uniref:GGDEF domain-containing protein n=1 Tax=Thiobacillus sp. TaxID=924 RepID=UPI0028942C54|nr:sensor domain-containing diguanylate cyclase [Thiobacillus sp.]MDT3707346.1 sensor domain-containing diguanylate cyclase [Thiobacillus sp.]
MPTRRAADKRPKNFLTDGPAEPFRAIVAAAADGVIGIDASQKIVMFNRAAEEMFGRDAAATIGEPLTVLLPAALHRKHTAHVRGYLERGEDARYMAQRSNGLRAVRADGTEFAVAISIQQVMTGAGPMMVAHVRDISDRIALLEQHVQLATRDHLTGVLNRRAFVEKANEAHERWQRGEGDYTLLMLDLDHFKSINDTYGHAAGDGALRNFAALCEATLRRQDLFARWGGEEFVALLPHADVAAAAAVAERIRTQTGRRTTAPDGIVAYRQTVSIGIAGPVRTHPSFDNVLYQADRALYVAKSQGRNRIAIAEELAAA